MSARLSLPHCAGRGDSREAIGRVVNYLENPMSLIQTIAVNGDSVREAIELKRSYINSIPVAASEGDSLTLSYDIRHEGGFYDGEERKIPIFEQGLMKSYGDFKILSTDKPYLFTVDPALGDVTLYAETSAIELFKRELNWVINYTYGCNEQMASKINALLMLKRLNALQGEVFKSEKDLQALIDRLVSNQNSEKLWGWWNQGTTESWISEYVINALLNARDAGYKIELNDEVLIYYLHRMVEVEIDMIRNKVNRKYVSKQKALSGMILLKRIDQLYPFPYQNSYEDLAAMMPDRGLEDRLNSQYAVSTLGLCELMIKESVVRY